MAVGISALFGVSIPTNFNAPYRSASMIEFWRRWHISLSQFLKDYVYIPLGGSRCSSVRRFINLGLTMAIGGFWHGASWNFLLWGMYHGLLLVCNHGIRSIFPNHQPLENGFIKTIKVVCTFGLVVVGWIVFKAHDLPQALSIYKGLLGFNGLLWDHRITQLLAWIGVSMVWVRWVPETHHLSDRVLDSFRKSTASQKTQPLGLIVLGAGLFVISLTTFFKVQTFLYWTF